MGYEILLILPVIYIVGKGIGKSMTTVKARLCVRIVCWLLYILYFTVWPSPVGFSTYNFRPYFRGARNMRDVDGMLESKGKKFLRKLGFEEVRGSNEGRDI